MAAIAQPVQRLLPYGIVSNIDIAGLSVGVSHWVEQGYEPVGSPFFAPDKSEWCQAMWKRPQVIRIPPSIA